MNIVRINESFAKNKFTSSTTGSDIKDLSAADIDIKLCESFEKLVVIKNKYTEALAQYKSINKEKANYKSTSTFELLESYKKAVDDLKLEFEDEKATFEVYKKIKNKTLTEAEVKLSPEDTYNPDSISLMSLAKKASEEERIAKEKADKEIKFAELKNKNAGVIDDLAHAVADGDEPKDTIEMLFSALVPQSGTAETVAGEIVRAVMRLLYRWFNDGDYFYTGYGIETCGRTIEYLVDDVEVLSRDTVEDWIDACANRDDDETYYESILDEICEAAIAVLDANPDLFYTPNSEDSRLGKLNWIESVQPLYDLEVSIPYDLLRHIEEENITEYDLEGELEYWETGYGSIGNNSNEILVYSDSVYIYGLPKDVYMELEDVLERWLQDYANDLTNQYGDPDEEPEENGDNEDESDEDLDEDLMIVKDALMENNCSLNGSGAYSSEEFSTKTAALSEAYTPYSFDFETEVEPYGAIYCARELTYDLVDDPKDAEKLYNWAAKEDSGWDSEEFEALGDFIGDALEAANYHDEVFGYESNVHPFPYWRADEVSDEDSKKIDTLIAKCKTVADKRRLLWEAINAALYKY